MIIVTIKQSNNQIQQVEMKGHADYSERGSDIVCASASTMAILTENLIHRLSLSESVKIQDDEGYIKIEVTQQSELLQTVLVNMIENLKVLCEDYPKNIKIN